MILTNLVHLSSHPAQSHILYERSARATRTGIPVATPYIPGFLLGVAVTLDPEPTPIWRGVPGTAIRAAEVTTLSARAFSSAFLADLQTI